MEPSFALLESLGAYAAGIADIVDDAGPDPAGDLTDALDLARSAEGLLGALTGATAIVPAADDKRLTALTGFIQLVSDLAHERDQVQRLRRYVDGPGNSTLIAALREHLVTWNEARSSDAGLRYAFSVDLLRASAREIGKPPAVLPSAQRRAYAESFYSRAAGFTKGEALMPALAGLLDELETADADMRRALRENPKLSAKERAKIAAISRARLIQALDSFTQLITALK